MGIDFTKDETEVLKVMVNSEIYWAEGMLSEVEVYGTNKYHKFDEFKGRIEVLKRIKVKLNEL